jgi:hypothetical protein
MFILELFDKEESGHFNAKKDNSTFKMSDVRKTRLSLEHLNTIRMANDVRKFEQEAKAKDVAVQYAVAPEGGESPGLGV